MAQGTVKLDRNTARCPMCKRLVSKLGPHYMTIGDFRYSICSPCAWKRDQERLRDADRKGQRNTDSSLDTNKD
jgi:hypothetical protein